ncbi:MAG: AAA family ATPase, partial [Candidatus Methanomethylophilaceae archaeon]|nr:AAA family ATPase [Candidatus Methanomethylophilaceae archaeon]
MASKKFPDGVYDFRSLVLDGYHFVDKTMMIEDVCEAGGKVLLYTRPRRFGKSINLSMLDYFFNLKYKDEPDIFKGLKITSCEGFEKHKNAYPVIRMDFHNLQPSSLQDFEDSLKELVSSVSRNINAEIRPLLSDKNDIDVIDRCISRDLGRAALNNSVAELCNLLERVYGKAVMIFVDEYDHFIQNITDEKTYYGIIDRIKPFMECTFKMNRS